MCWKSESFLLILVVVLTTTVSSFDSKCTQLKLVSGRSRYTWRGRSVRFNCMRGFQLVGAKYATCMNGKWDAEVPICVRYGCQAPSTQHVNGQFIESYRGAVVKIVCNPGYSLVGSPSVYCNGRHWNESFPVCRVSNSNPALSCDFETQDLCGWSQDPMHDFDWKRMNDSFEDNRSQEKGYYMYIKSFKSSFQNETARFYSPVYPAQYSNWTCFKFWYFMYGGYDGNLKIFVKPEGVELYNLIPSFWVNEDLGRSWQQGYFTVEPTNAPFQIVVEGVRGVGAGSFEPLSTGFDRVNLTVGEDCAALGYKTTTEYSTTVNSEDDDDAVGPFTCKNRCNEQETASNATDEGRCNCYENCDRDGTCCSDYFDLCTFFASTTKTSPTEVNESASSSSPPPSQTTPSEPPPPPPKVTPPTQSLNNESNEIDPKKPFHEVVPNRTSLAVPPSPPSPPPPPPPVKNETKPERVSPANETKTVATFKNVTKVEKLIPERGPEGKEEVKVKVKADPPRTSPVVTSPPVTTPEKVRSARPRNYKMTFSEKPSSPLLSNESRFQKGTSKEPSVAGKDSPQAIKFDKHKESREGSLLGIVEVGGTLLAVLVLIILGVLWYRRSRSKKTERESMVEDSDSIIYKVESSALGGDTHSLVCIRPGALQQSL